MADKTAIGMESFNAQQKSTIRIDAARAVLRVRIHVRRVAPNVHGTSLSASLDAFASDSDFSFSDS